MSDRSFLTAPSALAGEGSLEMSASLRAQFGGGFVQPTGPLHLSDTGAAFGASPHSSHESHASHQSHASHHSSHR